MNAEFMKKREDTTMTKPIARMLTINEAAESVEGLTKYRIRQMCITGELPHIKAGKKYLINEEALFKLIRA